MQWLKEILCFHKKKDFYLYYEDPYYDDIKYYKCKKCGARRSFNSQTQALLNHMAGGKYKDTNQ